MEWYMVVSLCFCAANFVTSLALVGLSSYHLYDDDRFVPVKESHDWYELVIGLIPFAIFVMVVSLFSLWGVIQKNRKWAASVVGLNGACVIGSIVFVIFSSQLVNAPDISEEELLIHTKAAVDKLLEANDEPSKWIPTWLNHIQNDSSSCCGIITYKDWEELWSLTPSLIPESCCIHPMNDTTICPKDLARIPYPGTPARFIKVDHGCSEEINQQIKRHILETYKFVWIMTAFVIVGELSYTLLYFLRYYCSGMYKRLDKIQRVNMMNAGDMGNGDDSYDGLTKITVTQIGSSTEALPGNVRIDPDTGNPVVSFNVVSYDNNASKAQSGSSSITSTMLPSAPVTKPILNLNNYDKANPQNDYSSGYNGNKANVANSSGIQNNKNRNDGMPNNTNATEDTFTMADPVSSVSKPQRRAVFLVQDSTDFDSMDDITSGIGSRTSFDDIGDLPSQETNRSQNQQKETATAGITRKKRF